MAKDDIMVKHHKMWGWCMLILGIIVLTNAYWAYIRWDYLIGIVLVVLGLKKALMCCKKK